MNFRSARGGLTLAGVTGLLVVAALAAARSSLRLDQADELPSRRWDVDPVTARPTVGPAETAAAGGGDGSVLPGWVDTLMAATCALAVAAVVGLLLWVALRDVLRRVRERTRASGARPATATHRPAARTAEEVVAAVDAGLVELSDVDADPRRGVIACWLRLEQAAAAAGTPRRIGDTPTDLVARLLSSHDVSADVLAAFARVYRQARYATRTVDAQMRHEARAALRRLRAELSAGVAP